MCKWINFEHFKFFLVLIAIKLMMETPRSWVYGNMCPKINMIIVSVIVATVNSIISIHVTQYAVV